jgi:hypothetical protein
VKGGKEIHHGKIWQKFGKSIIYTNQKVRHAMTMAIKHRRT